MKIEKLKKKKYLELTAQEKMLLLESGVINGCGGSKSWFRPPNFFWVADCDHHDFNFWVGGGIRKFLKANWGFYKAMLYDVNKVAMGIIIPIQQIMFVVFFIIATMYMLGVMVRGYKYFNWK